MRHWTSGPRLLKGGSAATRNSTLPLPRGKPGMEITHHCFSARGPGIREQGSGGRGDQGRCVERDGGDRGAEVRRVAGVPNGDRDGNIGRDGRGRPQGGLRIRGARGNPHPLDRRNTPIALLTPVTHSNRKEEHAERPRRTRRNGGGSLAEGSGAPVPFKTRWAWPTHAPPPTAAPPPHSRAPF